MIFLHCYTSRDAEEGSNGSHGDEVGNNLEYGEGTAAPSYHALKLNVQRKDWKK